VRSFFLEHIPTRTSTKLSNGTFSRTFLPDVVQTSCRASPSQIFTLPLVLYPGPLTRPWDHSVPLYLPPPPRPAPSPPPVVFPPRPPAFSLRLSLPPHPPRTSPTATARPLNTSPSVGLVPGGPCSGLLPRPSCCTDPTLFFFRKAGGRCVVFLQQNDQDILPSLNRRNFLR